MYWFTYNHICSFYILIKFIVISLNGFGHLMFVFLLLWDDIACFARAYCMYYDCACMMLIVSLLHVC